MKNQRFDPALWDTEITMNRNNSRIFPLSKGSKVQDFEFEKFWLNDSVKSLSDTFAQFCASEIKVVSFLTPGWNTYAEIHLERLKKCYSEIKSFGAELCLFVKGTDHQIHDFVADAKIPFWIGKDENFSIAKKFGVFDENHQPWHSISGISEDGPFPSIFVVNKKSEVIYANVDLTFEKPFSFLEVAVAVYSEKQQHIWHSFETNRKATNL